VLDRELPKEMFGFIYGIMDAENKTSIFFQLPKKQHFRPENRPFLKMKRFISMCLFGSTPIVSNLVIFILDDSLRVK
jgi:hypothetical protein